MSTITYKCDNCKRTVEYLENIHGLTHIGKCTITKNCGGNLYKQFRNQNSIRTNIPTPHIYVGDYTPRKLFYRHINNASSSLWEISHNMGLSCVFIVYNKDGDILDKSNYSVNNNGTVAIISFNKEYSGEVHILARNDVRLPDTITTISPEVQTSYNNFMTFAVPEYITRYDSGASVGMSSDGPINICGEAIRIEVEVTRPNESPTYCYEELSPNNSQNGPWYGWNKILVRNRKHYCVYSLNLRKLKSLTPLYSTESFIPDGTIIKITKISYGDSDFYNIPDKGLLTLLSRSPFSHTDKILDRLIDCGEMVGSYHPGFIFNEGELFTNSKNVENTYPTIRKSG